MRSGGWRCPWSDARRSGRNTRLPGPSTRSAGTKPAGVQRPVREPESSACGALAALPRPSRSPSFYVEDPGGVERGGVHASPPGREVPASRGIEAEVVTELHVVERIAGQLRRVCPHPVNGGVRESRLAQTLALQVLSISATVAAHRGAAAEVPPASPSWPKNTIANPLFGSASAATSGTCLNPCPAASLTDFW